MKQKHFIDIQNIRENSTDLRMANTQAFEVGNHIQITEKFDGSNACAAFDKETEKMVAFSRKNELTFSNTLGGFWNYIQALPEESVNVFKEYSDYRVFGEWSNKNKIIYNDSGKKKHWYVYDIYDMVEEKWQPQAVVKLFCKHANLEYIHELYNGEFISWEHCRSFMNSPAYGDKQEGIVVKNQHKIYTWDDDDTRAPAYLKIVNEDFQERMKTHEKIIDPKREEAKAEAWKMMESVCTLNRVEKELYKMRDEGILPEKLQPQDMGLIARTLPKRIQDDLMKEEKELVIACGEFGGKASSSICMAHARKLVLGE